MHQVMTLISAPFLTWVLGHMKEEKLALGTAFSVGQAGRSEHSGGKDPGWIVLEFNQVKERLGQMERKSEALCHSQVGPLHPSSGPPIHTTLSFTHMSIAQVKYFRATCDVLYRHCLHTID